MKFGTWRMCPRDISYRRGIIDNSIILIECKKLVRGRAFYRVSNCIFYLGGDATISIYSSKNTNYLLKKSLRLLYFSSFLLLLLGNNNIETTLVTLA